MKIKLLVVGKTDNRHLISLIDDYTKRLKFYIPFEVEIIPDIKRAKNMSEANLKKAEGDAILKHVTTADNVILLDEKGKSYSSVGFSKLLQKKMNSGLKTLVFVIGGPYGFSDEVYSRANGKISRSEEH